MKIVQLCPYAMDRPGGVQRHVKDLSAWLSAQGHDVRIIAPPSPGARPRSTKTLTEVGRARSLAVHGTAFELSFAAPWKTRRVASELRSWGAEVVHNHTPWTPALVGQMTNALSLATVTTIHATLPDPNGADIVDRYIRWSAKRHLLNAAAVVTPSQAPVPMLQTLLPGLDPFILPPAIDLNAFVPGQKQPLSCLFAGRLEPRKGLSIAIAAWPKIKAALPEATLTIAGDGPMRELVQDRPDLTYAGRPSDAELRELMAASDIFLAPAPYGESYGLILAEAMAAGAIPVAAANAGYASVMHDLPELLVEPNDAAALAERVIAIAQDDRAPLRQRVQEVAQASDVSSAGPAYLAIYREALER